VLQRAVAVKVMRPDADFEELFAKRFHDEAVHAAALMHTNIATLFDYGEDDGLAFLVMELVKGEPLSVLLRRRGALPAPEVRSLLGQAALALGVAHEARVIHRDVKPANILVRPDGLVKLTDFGIARALDAAGHTRAGEMLGTPDYISPEQAMGEVATGASDLYALGVVAHEMLTGRRPFDKGTPIATALSHVTEPPPPLPDDTPPDLAALVEDCLQKDPADRPANAREVALRVGINETEMAGLSLGLARALDRWKEHSPDTEPGGAVLRFPDLGPGTVLDVGGGPA
jgi:serine/threonine-protein kinase